MLHEILKEKKKELGLTTEQLSRQSGVPIGTINKILNGETRSPRYDTLIALERILLPSTPASSDDSILIREASPVYNAKKQGDYTLKDYYALPDDVRAELIDGTLIYMDAPSFSHQDMSMALALEIEFYVRANKGPWKVLAAPLDVQLDCDDKTMVQPDIVVTCRKENRTEKGIYGAPDMCIEIISDSTRRLDYGLKMTKYMNAGVREYWIVDIKRESVVCYYFEGEDYPKLYSFKDQVPVLIYDGSLQIDFSLIKERLSE